jgi:hypothetical protein
VNERPRRNNLFRLGASLTLLAAALLVFLYRQFLIDSYNAWTYHPSTEVASISKKAKLTDTGRFYLYASKPEINDRSSFNQHCVSKGEKTALLGCYAVGRIYVFDVTDSRLDGIKEVTAAHEMLHAAYERLSDDERARIDRLVEAELASINDTRIKELVELYDTTEPGERANELHSILGTEVATLDPQLEQYYTQYFLDRQVLVRLSAKYESFFSQINDEQNALVDELNSLAARITDESKNYNDNTNRLNADISSFNQRANNGGFASQDEFNAKRQDLLSRQAALQSERTTLNSMIAEYNQKRAKLETLNGQAEELNRNINSQLTPVPSI